MPYRTVNGIQMYYTDWGTGRPVVLVHGWCISSDSWEYVINGLCKHGLRCVAMDLRGCGRSEHPYSGHDYDTLADDLLGLLTELDLREAVLVGHSMGGGVITRYLARHRQERVAGAVLIGTTTPFLLKTEDNPDGVDKSYFDAMVDDIERDRPQYVENLAPGFFGQHLPNYMTSPELVRWGVGLTLQASARAAVEMLRANSETDQRSELKSILTPTLLLHGDSDQSCPLEITARPTHVLMPCSTLKIYENVAHGSYITHATQISDDIAEFVRELRWVGR